LWQSRHVCKQGKTNIEETWAQTAMTGVGFEHMTVFERAKTFHVLDLAAIAVI
jgi:hypothetical protein